MKSLLVLTMLVAYCTGQAWRAPSIYKNGVKWVLVDDNTAAASQVHQVSSIYKPDQVSSNISEKKSESRSNVFDGQAQSKEQSDGYHIEKPKKAGLYEEPESTSESYASQEALTVRELYEKPNVSPNKQYNADVTRAQSQNYGKGVLAEPTDQINVDQFLWHFETDVHTLPIHHFYYVTV